MKLAVTFTGHDFDWFVERLGEGNWRDERNALFQCPAHDDGRPSLHVWEDDQGLGVHCFAGCSRSDIEDALEDAAPVARPKVRKYRTRPEFGAVVARYVYADENGEPLFRKLRYEPKDFQLQRAARPEWLDGIFWSPGLKNSRGELLVHLVPYRLPELLAAVERQSSVYIADGEKDCDRLAAEGVTATCSPYGMARWRDEWNEYLRGADVVVIADRDEPGYRAAAAIAGALAGIAASVRVVEAAEGKDAHDHLEAGFSVDEFTEVRDADA